MSTGVALTQRYLLSACQQKQLVESQLAKTSDPKAKTRLELKITTLNQRIDWHFAKLTRAGSSGIENLISLLADSENKIRAIFVDLLVPLKDPRTIEPLITLLEGWNNDPPLRASVIKALSSFRDFRVITALANYSKKAGPGEEFLLSDAFGAIGRAALIPLVELLKEKNSTARLIAVMSLGKVNDRRVIKPLISAFDDPDPWFRKSVVEALKELKEPEVFTFLCQALYDKSKWVSSEAAWALGKTKNQEATPLLLKALEHEQEDTYTYTSVIRALARLKDKRAFNQLITLTKEKEKEVQLAAIEALGDLGIEEAIPHLSLLLLSKNKDTSCTAAISLHKLGNESGIELLISHLRDPLSKYRRQIACCLKTSSQDKAINALIEVISDNDKEVADAAIRSLGKPNLTRAINPLISMLGDEKLGRAAGISLTFIGPAAVAPLISSLEDLDKNIRKRAAAALGLLKDDSAVKPLITLLSTDSESKVRERVATALGIIKNNAALPPLKKALKDPDKNVRIAAMVALSRLGVFVKGKDPHFIKQNARI
jgi:HEAT repeat protein